MGPCCSNETSPQADRNLGSVRIRDQKGAYGKIPPMTATLAPQQVTLAEFQPDLPEVKIYHSPLVNTGKMQDDLTMKDTTGTI